MQFTESEEQSGNWEKFKLLTASPTLSNTSFELSVNTVLKQTFYEA